MPNHTKAETPFVTDVKKLRDRARQHIENGAMTSGYLGDTEAAVTGRSQRISRNSIPRPNA